MLIEDRQDGLRSFTELADWNTSEIAQLAFGITELYRYALGEKNLPAWQTHTPEEFDLTTRGILGKPLVMRARALTVTFEPSRNEEFVRREEDGWIVWRPVGPQIVVSTEMLRELDLANERMRTPYVQVARTITDLVEFSSSQGVVIIEGDAGVKTQEPLGIEVHRIKPDEKDPLAWEFRLGFPADKYATLVRVPGVPASRTQAVGGTAIADIRWRASYSRA